MNTAEKIASVYFRLNGFLQLPLFTVFNGESHNHIDLLCVRMANSIERVGEFTLPIDTRLFEALDVRIAQSQQQLLKMACEVRVNRRRDKLEREHVAYASRFLGDGELIQTLVYDNFDLKPRMQENYLHVGVVYACKWLKRRFKAMQDQRLHLTKHGSWHLSDEFLADLLVLSKWGVLN